MTHAVGLVTWGIFQVFTLQLVNVKKVFTGNIVNPAPELFLPYMTIFHMWNKLNIIFATSFRLIKMSYRPVTF